MDKQAKQTNSRISIGLRLKKCRKKSKRTGAESALLYGISQTTWSRMENGKSAFDSDDLFKLAKFLEVSPTWLLTGEGEMGISISSQTYIKEGIPSKFNPNQKPENILVESIDAGDINGEKGAMNDTDSVEYLKDHIATLRRQNAKAEKEKAKLEAKIDSLQKDKERLQEEKMRLLTLSQGKGTTQAGSG
jgi:transcriptional regulator with XRE-family HTH domain